MNINFELEAHRAMAPRPRSECVVLSAEQLREYNEDFDDYMAKAYRPEDRLTNEEAVHMAEWVFAVTGRLFVRVVVDGHDSQASTPDENGVQFMVVNKSSLMELFDIAMEVLDDHKIH